MIGHAALGACGTSQVFNRVLICPVCSSAFEAKDRNQSNVSSLIGSISNNVELGCVR
jgi:hypothetical protein